MLELVYQLPWPPSVNHIYSRTRKGGVMLNPRSRAYRDEVIYTIGKGHTAMTGDLRVVVNAYMPDRRKRDIDNPNKAILDAMTHAGVWKDDSQIKDLRIIHRGVEAPGRVVVTVSQIQG